MLVISTGVQIVSVKTSEMNRVNPGSPRHQVIPFPVSHIPDMG